MKHSNPGHVLELLKVGTLAQMKGKTLNVKLSTVQDLGQSLDVKRKKY